ncbi:hypothetical protein FGO68_gene6800 [Halteria grandinella]|uniref:Uncharacterized protein n=1 Tax=Halteria grandinella TaxID=5974 RepID=A0A8J8N9Y0_HALGN|nr:hypothetical protein FGO68_gene6800 [Halteria grandinella]
MMSIEREFLSSATSLSIFLVVSGIIFPSLQKSIAFSIFNTSATPGQSETLLTSVIIRCFSLNIVFSSLESSYPIAQFVYLIMKLQVYGSPSLGFIANTSLILSFYIWTLSASFGAVASSESVFLKMQTLDQFTAKMQSLFS